MYSGQRIAKVIARSGVCSRREAERLIEQGSVEVNSEVIQSPALNVTDQDIIKVQGKIISAAEPIRLWLFYKPTGVITSTRDSQGRQTVFEILPKSLPRVISVGRLDLNSEGLLLLTNSGELAREMELPSSNLDRKYRCRVHGRVTDEMIDKLKSGVIVEGIRYGSIKVTVDRIVSTNTWVTVILKEGKNREIRRTFEYFDLKVSRLIRVSYHEFELGDLNPSEVREVPGGRVKKLLKQLNIKED
ncbi:rRNA pseudouridine synthase [Holosporaceae bacterium 'Namur']|nr:rRNA pseudouridine synthase [Holosporaceae bacterium 'Namur']